MNCPTCGNVNLVMSERQGIEIDYCPNCRGVWLDRGELDKIIDRSVPTIGGGATSQSQGSRLPPQQHPQQSDPYNKRYKKKKREGFLSELFDFD